MTTTPQAALLSDAEIAQCINQSRTNLFDRAGTTSFRIARAIEQAVLAKLQPAQAGELPEPDAVFYCSEDTGYLTQYRLPPANLTDGDVAMYEADTVRAMLDRAALEAQKAEISAEEIYRRGWVACAGWAKRDDLIADIGSAEYANEMRGRLALPCCPQYHASEA